MIPFVKAVFGLLSAMLIMAILIGISACFLGNEKPHEIKKGIIEVQPGQWVTFGGLSQPKDNISKFKKGDVLKLLGKKEVFIDEPIYMGKRFDDTLEWFYYIHFNIEYKGGALTVASSEHAIVPEDWLEQETK